MSRRFGPRNRHPTRGPTRGPTSTTANASSSSDVFAPPNRDFFGQNASVSSPFGSSQWPDDFLELNVTTSNTAAAAAVAASNTSSNLDEFFSPDRVADRSSHIDLYEAPIPTGAVAKRPNEPPITPPPDTFASFDTSNEPKATPPKSSGYLMWPSDFGSPNEPLMSDTSGDASKATATRKKSRISTSSVLGWISKFHERRRALPRNGITKRDINAMINSFTETHLAVQRAHELVPSLQDAKR